MCVCACALWHFAAFAFYLHQRVVYAVIRSEKMHIVLSGKYGRLQIVHFTHTHTEAQYRAMLCSTYMCRFAQFRPQMKIDREILCQYCKGGHR